MKNLLHCSDFRIKLIHIKSKIYSIVKNSLKVVLRLYCTDQVYEVATLSKALEKYFPKQRLLQTKLQNTYRMVIIR